MCVGACGLMSVERRVQPAFRKKDIAGALNLAKKLQAGQDVALGYLGAHRMNTYEYAPKDDPYHREQWRDPYPADKLAELGELVERARSNKVDFTFALSPGLSICYTSDSDYQALIAKFEALYALGARAFNVPLDDIDYNTWHCAADREKYGTGGGAAG